MHGAVVEFPAEHTLADTVVRHDQVDGEIFDKEFRALLQRLAIKRVQDRVAGPVSGGAGTLHGRAFAEFRGVAAEGTLIDLALFGAREGHAVMLKLVNRLGRFAGEVFHRIGIAQPVRALDRVIHMPLPVVGAHVAQGRGDATLRRHRVAAGREHLRDTGRAQPLLRHAQSRAQTSTACPHHDNVIFVGFVFICCHLIGLPFGRIVTGRAWRWRKRRPLLRRS